MKRAALVLLLSSVAVQAGAQSVDEPASPSDPPSDADLRNALAEPSITAGRAYELGVLMFESRRYDAAERAWLRAYSIGRDPKLLVAVADTRQRRDDAPGAVAMLEQYLIERPDAPDRASIEARIATLLKSPARLIVRSMESGHAILLDGRPSGKKTPATLEVEPGEHTVVVVGEGRQVGERTVRVASGEVAELDFTPRTPSHVILEESEEATLQTALVTEREDQTIRRAVISTGAISAAGLVSGTILGVLALKKQRDYDGDPTEQTADRGERLAIFADASFGLAILSGITSFTLFMTHKNKRKREGDTARLQIQTRGAGAAATVRF